MIRSRRDLKNYLEIDKNSFLAGNSDNIVKKMNKMRRFYVSLRKCEYYHNTKKSIVGKCLYLFWKYRYRRLGLVLGWDIPINVLDAGARIVHPGTVVINGAARVGQECRIHACVNIGASKGKKEAPQIGNHVYIGPGAKIFGDIKIADDIAIGANAVVNKSFLEPGITIAGVPAKKISDEGFNFD